MDYELIWWLIHAGLGGLFVLAIHLPWNPSYDPKGNDPYRYCPKEEE